MAVSWERSPRSSRGFRASALHSVFSKWYTTVLVALLREEKEPIERRSLHVGAVRGVDGEKMQALLTVLQGHWEWQERWTDLEPGFYRYSTAFLASLDVKTALDVAKASVVSGNPLSDRCSRHVVAACWLKCRAFGGPRVLKTARRSSGFRGASAKAEWRPSVVGAGGQIRVLESRGKVQGQRMGSHLRRRTRQPVRAAGCDVVFCDVTTRRDWCAR